MSGAIIPPAWMGDALCAQTDPELFFPPPGGTSVHARRICQACPVHATCRAFALADPTLDGIWGDTTVADRQTARREAA